MNLAKQMKARRKQLSLQQKDMKLRIGMEQQQYSRIEAGGNANLKNLELIAEGLDAELMLIPKEAFHQVRGLLENVHPKESNSQSTKNIALVELQTLQSKLENLSKNIPVTMVNNSSIKKMQQFQDNLRKLNAVRLPELKLNDSTLKAMQQLEDKLDKLNKAHLPEVKLDDSTLKAMEQLQDNFSKIYNKIYSQNNNVKYLVNKVANPWKDILD